MFKVDAIATHPMTREAESYKKAFNIEDNRSLAAMNNFIKYYTKQGFSVTLLACNWSKIQAEKPGFNKEHKR